MTASDGMKQRAAAGMAMRMPCMQMAMICQSSMAAKLPLAAAPDDGDGERTDDHRQEEAGHGEGHGHGDGRGDGGGLVGAAVDGDDHQDRGGDRREGRVRGDGRADVGPAEGHHLQGAAEDDARLEVAAHQTDERARDERLVELPLVKDAFHAGEEGNDDNQDDCENRHVSLLLMPVRPARTWPCSSWSRSSRASQRGPCGRRT